MCAPYFFLFIDSNQRQAAPNLFANLAETVRWTVSQQVAQPWCAAVKCPFGACVCVLRIFHSINGLGPTTSSSKFVCKFGRNSPVDCFAAGCTALVRCGKLHFRRMCMCTPYFFLLLTRTNDKLLQIWLRQIWQKQSGGLFRSRLHSLWWLIFTVINGDIVGRCWHRPYIFMFFIEHDYKKAGG